MRHFLHFTLTSALVTPPGPSCTAPLGCTASIRLLLLFLLLCMRLRLVIAFRALFARMSRLFTVPAFDTVALVSSPSILLRETCFPYQVPVIVAITVARCLASINIVR